MTKTESESSQAMNHYMYVPTFWRLLRPPTAAGCRLTPDVHLIRQADLGGMGKGSRSVRLHFPRQYSADSAEERQCWSAHNETDEFPSNNNGQETLRRLFNAAVALRATEDAGLSAVRRMADELRILSEDVRRREVHTNLESDGHLLCHRNIRKCGFIVVFDPDEYTGKCLVHPVCRTVLCDRS